MNGAGFVVDASALVFALASRDDDAAELRDRIARGPAHAPHLVDAEVGNVLRRQERASNLEPDEAAAALHAAHALIRHRYPVDRNLAGGAWGLRHNLSYYDAIYAALSAQLGLPLVTADARLARAPSLPCTVRLV